VPQKTDKLSAEIKEIKKEIVMLKQSFKKPNTYPSCGNTILARFQLCPYRGESLPLNPEQVIVEKLK
jgi:hypothetical protein